MTPINPGLFLLSWLRFAGALRQMGRKIKTVKGALLYGFGLLMFFYWVPWWVASRFGNHDNESLRELMKTVDPDVPRFGLSVSLLVYCVLKLLLPGKGAGIPFTMSEVDFLFAGPFSRRELLLHKMGGYSLRILPTGLIFAVLLVSGPWLWLGVFGGSFLSFSLVLLFGLAVNMAGQVVNARLYTPARRLVALTLAALFALGMWHALIGSASAGMANLPATPEDFAPWFVKLKESVVLGYVLTPFDAFSRTLTATQVFPDLVLWGSAAFAIDLALVYLILRLDANYLEASLEASQKMYDRLQQFRSRGTIPLSTLKPQTNLTLPDFPALGGAGPLAWRQLLSALRGTTKTTLIVLALLVPGLGVALAKGADPEFLWAVLGGIGGMFMFFFSPMILGFDFRADLDRMEQLKVLPLPSWVIAAGQLAAPVLVASLVEVCLLGSVVCALGKPLLLLPIVLFAPVVNVALFSIENLLFLLFPARLFAVKPGDFQAVARMYLSFLVKFVVFGVCFGAAAGLGGLTYWLTDGLWVAAGGVAWLVIALEAATLVPCVAWAFRHFDPSTDVPA